MFSPLLPPSSSSLAPHEAILTTARTTTPYILLRIHLGTVVQVQVHTRIFEQGSCVFRLPGSPPRTHHNLILSPMPHGPSTARTSQREEIKKERRKKKTPWTTGCCSFRGH